MTKALVLKLVLTSPVINDLKKEEEGGLLLGAFFLYLSQWLPTSALATKSAPGAFIKSSSKKSNLRLKFELLYKIGKLLYSRALWSCGLMHHVLDWEVEGSVLPPQVPISSIFSWRRLKIYFFLNF